MRDYISLHTHSEYSNIKIIDSINRIDRMIDYAWELGLSGLAMTEHDCLSGTLKALDCFKAKLDKEWKIAFPETEKPDYNTMANILDFKVLLGNEIYLTAEGADKDYTGNYFHYLLIAKDAEGYRQLKQLSSRAWKRSWMKAILRTPTYPSDLFDIVSGGHLVCSTACLGGYPAWCWKMMNSCSEDTDFLTPGEDRNFYLNKLDNHLEMMEELFGKGNYFIELQPNEGMYGQEQIGYNKFMIERYWGKYPFIFTTDAHYLKADEREIHKAFLNSKSSKDREVDEFYRYAYIMSQQEVRDLMPYLTDEQFNIMVENSRSIKDMCEVYEIEQKQVLAKVQYEHFEEYKEDLEIFNEVDEETYPNFYYYLHTNNKADQYLARLVAHGFVEKWEDHWDDEVYFARLEEEFWTIKEIGARIGQDMSDYFITMSKMIDIMWNEANSLVGPSRGSAGALLINFLLGITQMNPVEMELPFVWRFLHPSRPDLPDIDVDSESDKRAQVFNEIRKYFNSIGGDVINVCTFGTEGTKSAIKTAARGLNIDDDVVTYITSMIPNERGFDWTLKDCYYGNGDDRAPIKTFVEQMTEYPRLWELAQNIEGLITRLGVHASGVVCVNGDFTNYNSYMKTSKGQLVTAFDLHTLERCGLVKYDLLTVSALDRIRQTMNYMLEDGTIEWQGSLRKTYNKYLAPNVLDYNSKEMWDMVGRGEITSLFQFDTLVGAQAIKDIQPRSLFELAISSSLMRLMGEGELPLAKYARFKRVPALWYNEMREYGLDTDEIKILEKYLSKKCGVGESQEVIMQIVMDPQISGFDMKEANKLRKTIAKKQFRAIEEVKQLFFEKGLALGTSSSLLDYIWDVQVSMQLGYSFSEIHTTAYALIALQEMNLAYRYPIIYWNTACLSVDASAINSADFYNLIDEDILDIDETEGKKIQNKMDYAKIAAALDRFKRISNIRLPDINDSRLSFTPNVETNSILYGLKGIVRVTEPVIQEIMDNRPFSSLDDFLTKVTKKIVTKDKVINLIKCGAFDKVENKTRREILNDYIWKICEPKSKLTMQNMNMLIDLELLPKDLEYVSDVYKLTKELRKNRDANKMWYCGDRLTIPPQKFNAWAQIIKDSKLVAHEIMLDGEPRRVIDSAQWDRFYELKMEVAKRYIKENHDELLKLLNNTLFNNEFEKYCSGNELQWELDSINFYFTSHPLDNVAPQIDENICGANDVIEGAQDGEFIIKGKVIPRMRLYSIIGTVIDKDKVKGLVTIQCPDGVVNVKIYKNLFALYNQTISNVNEVGEKEIEDESFFEKGTHLLVTGIQRGATFVPKVYKNTGYKSIMRIVLDDNGRFVQLQEKEGEA